MADPDNKSAPASTPTPLKGDALKGSPNHPSWGPKVYRDTMEKAAPMAGFTEQGSPSLIQQGVRLLSDGVSALKKGISSLTEPREWGADDALKGAPHHPDWVPKVHRDTMKQAKPDGDFTEQEPALSPQKILDAALKAAQGGGKAGVTTDEKVPAPADALLPANAVVLEAKTLPSPITDGSAIPAPAAAISK